MSKWYTIYKGDDFICQGTRDECARYLEVKADTISFMTTPVYKKRREGGDNHLIVLVDKDNEEEILEDLKGSE